MAHVQHSTVVPADQETLFKFISDYRKRSRVMPPDIQLDLMSIFSELKKEAQYEFKITRYGFNYSFTVRAEQIDPYNSFTESTSFGIFKEWINTFKFEKHSEKSTLLTSIIDYKISMGVLGTLADDLYVKKDIERILVYAHDKTKGIFE